MIAPVLKAAQDGSTAVFAKAKTQPGVSGISESNDGVRAVSTSGHGLSAFSSSNTGIFAKAPINAGFFEGNVTVTGELSVHGVSFSSLQQQVNALTARINTLEQTQRSDEQILAARISELQQAVQRIIGALRASGINV